MTADTNAYIDNPYAVFSAARAQHPIVWQDLLGVSTWLVTGYKEVEAILKDNRFIREARRVTAPEELPVFSERIAPVMQLMQNMMLFRDAPTIPGCGIWLIRHLHQEWWRSLDQLSKVSLTSFSTR